MVAHAVGDVVAGDTPEPEVVVSVSPSVGGLLDSLTGRAKPAAAPVPASSTSSTALGGAVASDAPNSRPLDKDTLRNFISSSMPFGRYSLLWYFPPQICYMFGYMDQLIRSNGYLLRACWPLYRYTLGPQLFQYFRH